MASQVRAAISFLAFGGTTGVHGWWGKICFFTSVLDIAFCFLSFFIVPLWFLVILMALHAYLVFRKRVCHSPCFGAGEVGNVLGQWTFLRHTVGTYFGLNPILCLPLQAACARPSFILIPQRYSLFPFPPCFVFVFRILSAEENIQHRRPRDGCVWNQKQL